MNLKGELQEAQDIIHKEQLHLKQINSTRAKAEDCHFAISELEKAQQKIQQVQQRINE